ncbi:MAG TPA: hypothetical protein VK578_10390 [Edaphobacter sp.]|nr:hypothetical protein [Edaphobacter sp.]
MYAYLIPSCAANLNTLARNAEHVGTSIAMDLSRADMTSCTIISARARTIFLLPLQSKYRAGSDERLKG